MAKITSNKAALFSGLRSLADGFNLRRTIPGGKRRLGEELIDTAAVAIEDRTVNRQQDPSGKPLAPLKASTLARKRRLGLDSRILIETHEMLDLEQIRGKTFVDARTAVMQAGFDEETQQKVEAAQEGGPNRRKREFYDLGKDGEQAVDQLLNEVVARTIQEAERA